MYINLYFNMYSKKPDFWRTPEGGQFAFALINSLKSQTRVKSPSSPYQPTSYGGSTSGGINSTRGGSSGGINSSRAFRSSLIGSTP